MSAAPRVLLALDLDGTLEDSRADMVAAAQRVRASLGLPRRPDAQLVPHVNRGMDHLYRTCFAEHLEAAAAPEAAYAAVREAYVADYGSRIAEQTRLYDGMAEALGELASLGRLAVVTNKPEALSRQLLAALGVAQRFTAVIGGDSATEPKPSAAPLALAVRRCGLTTAEPAIMIGDSAGDVRCGRSYGATVIWCAWGYKDAPGELAPDHTAEAPSALPGLVREILGG